MSTARIVVIGAGITGVTTAYALLRQGHTVTVIDRNPSPAMETSFANGGQLSASNAEVWNSWGTIAKGLKWMLSTQAPLRLNPAPSLHKYGWFAEFMAAIRRHDDHTIDTVRLALEARRHLLEIAEREQLQFDLERRGILHLYHDKRSFVTASKANLLLRRGGLERYAVSDTEIHDIEPTLSASFYGGFYTPSDATGDIRKFTRGLADACGRQGAKFEFNGNITGVDVGRSVVVYVTDSETGAARPPITADAVVVCAGVASRKLASMFGDRINIYPVKGYSITVCLEDKDSHQAAPSVSLLDESAKIVTSRLGSDRFRVAGTAEFNGYNCDIRADRIEPLVRWSRRLFPRMSTATVIPWAGLRPMTPTMLPAGGSRPAGRCLLQHRPRAPGLDAVCGDGYAYRASSGRGPVLCEAV